MDDKADVVESLYDVMYSARALMHRLRFAVAQMHGGGELAAGERGVLMSLDELGPQTVPQLARARPVSRQHIQMLVNPLLHEGYVRLADNPAHKRSKLVQLTSKGRRAVRQMKVREARVFGALDIRLQPRAMRRAARTLDAVRALFESGEWTRIAEGAGRRRGRT